MGFTTKNFMEVEVVADCIEVIDILIRESVKTYLDITQDVILVSKRVTTMICYVFRENTLAYS